MASQKITVVGMSGHLFDWVLEMPCKNTFGILDILHEVKEEVKRQTGIPRREQKFMMGNSMVISNSILAKDENIVLTLVCAEAVCGNCGRGEEGHRRLLSCRGCSNIAYCGRKCQKSHWFSHRAYCRKGEAGSTLETQFETANHKCETGLHGRLKTCCQVIEEEDPRRMKNAEVI